MPRSWSTPFPAAAPGTLLVIEPDVEDAEGTGLNPHGMDPLAVLGLARRLGPLPARLLIVGCEPGPIPDGDSEEMAMGLSAPVAAAVEEAAGMVMELVGELLCRRAKS